MAAEMGASAAGRRDCGGLQCEYVSAMLTEQDVDAPTFE